MTSNAALMTIGGCVPVDHADFVTVHPHGSFQKQYYYSHTDPKRDRLRCGVNCVDSVGRSHKAKEEQSHHIFAALQKPGLKDNKKH